MKKTVKPKKNLKAIKRLGELLPDILDSFGWYGIETSVVEKEPDDAVAEGEDQTDDEIEEEGEEGEGEEEDYGEPEYFFDPSDVQVAVDEAISTFIGDEIIEEFSDPKTPPTLSEIFAVLFGEDSEIKKKIEYFEELISGYEDRAHIDDLKEAHGILQGVIKKISPKIPKT